MKAQQDIQQPSLRMIHVWLTIQSVVLVLLTINRLSWFTQGYVSNNEFLRWVDLNNMLVLPIASLAAMYLLKKQLEYDSPQREGNGHRILSLTFVLGVYLLGASYGNHEVTNYLNTRFCQSDNVSDLCWIIGFNDDQFSHLVFFTGFTLVNGSLLLIGVVFRRASRIPWQHVALLSVNGVIIGLAVFANLAFETVGFDLYVVGLLAALAIGLTWWRRSQPLSIYYSVAYGSGLVATLAYKGIVMSAPSL